MYQISVGEHTIDVVKRISRICIWQFIPNGRIRIAVPKHLDDETIRLHIVSKLGWIKKQITKFEQAERLPKGIHQRKPLFEGRYLLNVIPDAVSINQDRGKNTLISTKSWDNSIS